MILRKPSGACMVDSLPKQEVTDAIKFRDEADIFKTKQKDTKQIYSKQNKKSRSRGKSTLRAEVKTQ